MLKLASILTLLLGGHLALAQCEYTVRLYDIGGDGWNGSLVYLMVDGPAGMSIDTLTVESGSQVDHLFTATFGYSVVISYDALGPQQSENSIAVLAYSGSFIWLGQSAPTAGVNYAYVVNGTCNVPPPSTADCIGYAQAISNGPPTPLNLTGTGVANDLDPGNAGCLDVEHAGAWLMIYVYDGLGLMDLSIVPMDPPSNIDFALWGPLDNANCPMTGMPVRCSAAITSAATGLTSTSLDETEGQVGDGWVAAIPVQFGEVYVLYMDTSDDTQVPVEVSIDVDTGTGVHTNTSDAHAIETVVASSTVNLSAAWNGSIMVSDLHGRQIEHITANGPATLDVSTWPEGSYFVRCNSMQQRLVVIH